MATTRTTTTDRLRRGLLACGLLAVALAPRTATEVARAAVESESPVFTNPTEITNDYLPFNPGSVSVYAGRDRGAPVVIVTRHLNETRDFPWDGGSVTCRVVESLSFRRGKTIATERLYVAQSDAGEVWSFGDVDEDDDPNDDNGDDKDEPSGWIVGQRAPTDPADVVETNEPALRMPATPARGDAWLSENVAPHFLSGETVKQTASSLRVRDQRRRDILRIRSTDLVDASLETNWYAPGIGLVRSRGSGERLTLRASTLRDRR